MSPTSPKHNAASALLIRMLFPSLAVPVFALLPAVSFAFVPVAGDPIACRIAYLCPWTTSTPLAAPAE
jgi:hypothetical protein